jgi:hypothetical protein
MEGAWVMEVHSPRVFGTSIVMDLFGLVKVRAWDMNAT